ncbi:MAG: GNAT family N-acetyltransferase [Romboutsia sp.]|nr:GNAT family N-acetyltransferase [Romboutsia sp.]
MIKTVKLSKFNGELCENLYANIFLMGASNFNDITILFNKVISTIANKNWLKFRDTDYLQNVLNDGGFIVGCYVEDTLVACAICEPPSGDYLNNLYDIDMSNDEINSTYVSGYVMVDPLYRGNSLHKILLETRIKESIARGKDYILTAVAAENIFSLRTILSLGFEMQFERKNQYGINRYILLKKLKSISSKENEIIA